MRIIRPALAGTAVALLAASLTVGPATAAPTGVPAPGTTVHITETVTGVHLGCHGRHYTFNLAGTGSLTMGGPLITLNGHTAVPVTTATEDLTGTSADFGNITVWESEPVTGELVEHQPQHPFPARQALPLLLRITFGTNPCATPAEAAEPVTFQATGGAAVLVNGNLATFPPQGAVYQLQEPIDLAPVGGSQVVATLSQFPVTVSHNP